MDTNKRFTISIFLLFLYLGMYLSMIQRIVNEIAVSFSLNNMMMGLLIMTTFIGFFLSPILTGELSDKIGRKPMIVSAFIIMTAGSLLMVLINLPITVGTGLFLNGLAFGIFEMTLSAVLTDIYPVQTNRVLTQSRLFFALGTVSGPFAAIGIMWLFAQWKSAIVISIILLLGFFILFLLMPIPKKPIRKNEQIAKGEKSITLGFLKNQIILLLCIAIFMYVAVEAGLTFFVSKYIISITDNGLYASLTLSVFWICVAVGRAFSSKVNEDLSRLILILGSVAIVGLLFCALVDRYILITIAFGIMGIGCSAIYPTLLAIGKNQVPENPGTVFGIMLSAAALGGILNPYIMGAVADAYSLKLALAVCFVPLITIVVLMAVISQKTASIKVS